MTWEQLSSSQLLKQDSLRRLYADEGAINSHANTTTICECDSTIQKLTSKLMTDRIARLASRLTRKPKYRPAVYAAKAAPAPDGCTPSYAAVVRGNLSF